MSVPESSLRDGKGTGGLEVSVSGTGPNRIGAASQHRIECPVSPRGEHNPIAGAKRAAGG
jgi:hypothetical protein